MPTVRIVEDSVDLAHLWSEQLRYADWTAVTTTREFGRLLRPGPWEGVDAALVDLMLPGLSGVDVLRFLLAEHPGIHRVAMSASLPKAIEAEGLAAYTLVKPFSTDELVRALERP